MNERRQRMNATQNVQSKEPSPGAGADQRELETWVAKALLHVPIFERLQRADAGVTARLAAATVDADEMIVQV